MKHILVLSTAVLFVLPASFLAAGVSVRPDSSSSVFRSTLQSSPKPATKGKKKKETAKSPVAAKTPVASKSKSKPPAFAWPIPDRKILRKYGDRTNPTTNTVTLNPGIDISSKKGTDVRSAAAGTVSLVSWLPSYGTFVIVEHSSEYRSVYANLASTSVQKGELLKGGAKIGSVGASPGGAFLHFEIWRDTTRLDPARHLPAKRK